MAMDDGFSRNPVPTAGKQYTGVSNMGSGRSQSARMMAPDVTASSKGSGQDFVRNPVPLESPASATVPNSDWLQLARENYMVAKNYFDISVRRRVEDNLAHAFSRHASGSKYYDPAYDKRSKYFRPKTRAMMRKHEAACAIAFFSTMDVVNCEPGDNDNPDQVMASQIHTELLNYRLRKSIPWFKILMGGFWDSMTQGVVISCQEWRYREATIVDDEFDDLGAPTGNSRQKTKVTQDQPWIRLVPIENLLLHPSCDWTDPVNSSPYLIEKIPWFANELAEHIANARSYGSQVPYIKEFSEQELLAGASEQDNTASSLRMQRENTRLDRYSQVQQGQKFRPVWVHRNIVRIGGLDYVYETLGTTLLLSDPVPIEQVFGLERRPYVIGSDTIEPHRIYPAGQVERVKPTQEMMNELQNQRTDNIRLALNNRYLAKRGQMVDMRSLMRNVPGSITMTTDPNGDVKQLETKDVTSSAYQEQDRLNLDFDDLSGSFTQSTVGAARNLNERVKGMELMGNGADMVTELGLRTFSETWVTPVLSQVRELEAVFETDKTILGIVGSRTQTGGWAAVFHMLTEPVTTTVAVGFGNTDPMQRVQRLAIAAQTMGQVAPQIAGQSNQAEFGKEIMGALGYQDGARFYPSLKDQQQDPQIQQLQQQVQQLQQELQSQAQRWQTQENIAKIRAESAEKIAQIKADAQGNSDNARQAAQHFIAMLQGRSKQLDQQIAQEKNAIAQGNLLLEREALSNAIMQADREFQLKVATTMGVPQAQQPNVAVPTVPAGDEPFIQSLETPSSESVLSSIKNPHDGQQPKLPGEDAAGVIQRGHYGDIPGSAG